MRRLTLLVLFVCVGLSIQQSPQCRPRQHKRHQTHDNAFNDLAQKVLELDNKIKKACHQNSNAATKEMIQRTRYFIQTSLPNFTENDMHITIRRKVIQILARKGSQKYKEIRILPNFVDVNEAAFTLDDGVLEVTFPMAKNINICKTYQNDSVITVPKFEFGVKTGPRSLFLTSVV